MSKRVLIEETHLSFYVARTLSDAESTAIHRTLNGKRFVVEFKRTVENIVRRHPSLARVHV
jgi:hypothetical protein